MAEPKFEVFKDEKGEYRFRLRAPNGETILASEAYTSKQMCIKGIGAIKHYAIRAKVVDLTGEKEIIEIPSPELEP